MTKVVTVQGWTSTPLAIRRLLAKEVRSSRNGVIEVKGDEVRSFLESRIFTTVSPKAIEHWRSGLRLAELQARSSPQRPGYYLIWDIKKHKTLLAALNAYDNQIPSPDRGQG